MRLLERTDRLFRATYAARFGDAVEIGPLDATMFDDELLALARRTWQQRFDTELRSAQTMTRFTDEVLGAGEPLEIVAFALDLVEDEVRHAALCAAVCRALGVAPETPTTAPRLADEFLDAPMAERALVTAIDILVVQEAISVAYLEDLRARCATPAIRRVLDLTVGDEERHRDLGVAYVRRALSRFPEETMTSWRDLAGRAVAVHDRIAQPVLASLPSGRRALDAWPDARWIPAGLTSPERQALVYETARRDVVLPRLVHLGLASAVAGALR